MKKLNWPFIERTTCYSLTIGLVIAVVSMVFTISLLGDVHREQKTFQAYLENSVYSDFSNDFRQKSDISGENDVR